MGITDILSLLGGLALFLFGMQTMSNGLEAAAGNKMKSILEKLTSNRIMGVFVGAVITAVIQSSSATTVMVVGFVNSGLMTLNQDRNHDHRSAYCSGYWSDRPVVCDHRRRGNHVLEE